MDEVKYLIALSKAGFAQTKLMKDLWEYFGSLKEAWLASNADLLAIEGLKYDKIQSFIEARKKVDPDRLIEELDKKSIKFLTIKDENYPFLLKQIFDPPAVLFYKGCLKACNLDRTLGIVGSRKASHYVLEILRKLISELRENDVTIVSGMALGADSCAHKAALKNGLKTIAVLGSGINWIYPTENKKLYYEIINNNGAVMSEYYPDEKAEIWKFPKRNRIISGLCKGTLIAEAGLKSGALITAKLCIEQNRELMCIPGLVTNPNTEGVHKLIKEGAGLVTSAKDIFDNLNWTMINNININQNSLDINLLDNEKKVYEILDLEPRHFDEILNKSNLSIDELLVVLTSLELNGIIRQVSGQKYIRCYQVE